MPFRQMLPLNAACIALLACGGSLLGQTSRAEKAKISVDQLPITFEQNQGQTGLQARFLARSGSLYLEMLPAEIDLSLASASERATLKLELVDGDPKARITPLEQTGGTTNYFPGRDPSGWHLHIPNFRQVRYSNIYAGVDLLFYGKETRIEHDFIVAPFADYHQIRMRARGAREFSVQPDGSLKIALANGNLIFQPPDVYQVSARGREYRSGRFKLLARNEVGFAIGDYDRSPWSLTPYLATKLF